MAKVISIQKKKIGEKLKSYADELSKIDALLNHHNLKNEQQAFQHNKNVKTKNYWWNKWKIK
jgi:hypothetical protein